MNAQMQPVDPAKAYLLLNHGPVTLVSAAFGGERNVMAASWVMPLDFDPPRVAAVIDKNSFTRELVDASGEFALSVPLRAIAARVLSAGGVSGRDCRGRDKFAHAGLSVLPASVVGAPLVGDCAAWLECRVIPEKSVQQAYDLFVANVVAAWADPEVFSKSRWHFPDAARTTLHYQAGGAFFVTGERFDCDERGAD